jgi:ankyrin repeat protein
MTNIWRAAIDGDLAEVERLVGHARRLLDARNRRGRTPLMLASREGHVGVVRWLLDKGAAMDERDRGGRTALCLACEYDHYPVVRLLLERGADPAIVSFEGCTPLMFASDQGHLEVVRVLLGHPNGRATINQCDLDGETALLRACHWGHGGIVRALLESGADPTIADDKGTTPMAIAKQHDECW